MESAARALHRSFVEDPPSAPFEITPSRVMALTRF
jgi:hypothetical protein